MIGVAVRSSRYSIRRDLSAAGNQRGLDRAQVALDRFSDHLARGMRPFGLKATGESDRDLQRGQGRVGYRYRLPNLPPAPLPALALGAKRHSRGVFALAHLDVASEVALTVTWRAGGPQPLEARSGALSQRHGPRPRGPHPPPRKRMYMRSPHQYDDDDHAGGAAAHSVHAESAEPRRSAAPCECAPASDGAVEVTSDSPPRVARALSITCQPPTAA
jgi:hypothetical protein